MTMTATFDGPAIASRLWHASGQEVLNRVDLQGLVEGGALTCLRLQDDGSLLLECPEGLPAELEGLVEPAPEAALAEDDLAGRLSRLEGRLEALGSEARQSERLSDRLDTVEFGLVERMHGVIAEEVFNLFAEQQDPGPSVAERIDAILAAVQSPAPDSALLTRIEARLSEVSPLAATIEALFDRPAPEPDLTAMRQMNTRFLQAMQQVATDIEGARPNLDLAEHSARTEAQLSALAPLAEAVSELSNRIAPPPDMAALMDRLDATLAPLHGAILTLSDRVAALESRPAPDLTEQRKSFAILAGSLRRIEQARPAEDLQPQMDALLHAVAALHERPDPVQALLPLQETLATLAERVSALESPAPEEASPASLAEAIVALARRAPEREPGLAAIRTAQSEFVQDLRMVLTEVLAGRSQPQARAG